MRMTTGGATGCCIAQPTPPPTLCSADGSTHTKSNKLYRKVKHRYRPNLSPRQRPTAKSRHDQAALAASAEARGATHRARPLSPKVCFQFPSARCASAQGDGVAPSVIPEGTIEGGNTGGGNTEGGNTGGVRPVLYTQVGSVNPTATTHAARY